MNGKLIKTELDGGINSKVSIEENRQEFPNFRPIYTINDYKKKNG